MLAWHFPEGQSLVVYRNPNETPCNGSSWNVYVSSKPMGIDSNSEFIHEGHSLRDLYLLLRIDAHQKHDLHITKFLSSRCSSHFDFFFKVLYIEFFIVAKSYN